MRSRSILTATATVLLLTACAEHETSLMAPALATSRNVTSEASSDLWKSIVTGETGPGSVYALYMPHEWNGTVVYYAHGIRNILMEPEVSLRDQDNFSAIRDQLGAQGYAFAYSSFDENGYVVKDGAQRIHQLRGLFASRFGQPEQSLLVGHSLGGLISLDLAERFAKQYDGVAAFCSPAGGTQAELDHIITTRMVFDMYYPGLLAGAFDEIPQGYNIDPRVNPAKIAEIQRAILANPLGLLVIANTEQAGIDFVPSPSATLNTMINSVITKLVFHAAGYDNLLAQTNGKFPFDNLATDYRAIASLVVPPPFPVGLADAVRGEIASLNSRVSRTSGDQSALNYADKYFTPSGALTVPTMTLHNRWDPLVPFFHEPMLAQRVAATGASNLLLQRTSLSYGHCNFTVAEQVKAIQDLAAWVSTGVKPLN